MTVSEPLPTPPTPSQGEGKPAAPEGLRRRGTTVPQWMRGGRGHEDTRVVTRGHSLLVLALKIGLPLLALVMMGLIAAWPYLGVPKIVGKIDKNQTAMVNARFFSHDRGDQPFSMSAKSAAEVLDHRNLIDLSRPEAEMTQSNGSWLTVTSERGRYNQDDGRLLMLDHVHFLRDDGFEFVTDEAEIDTRTGNAWGDHKVIGQGPQGDIRADGFVAIDHGKTITFTHSTNASVSGAAAKGGSGKGSAPGKGNPK